MSLTTRLEKLEAALRHDGHAALLIVLEDAQGAWWVDGAEVDKMTVDPRTHVVAITEREDGPQ